MQVTHDKALDVALGNSRKTKTWKNKPMLWSELLDRMATPTRTPETVAEYKAMSRDRQSDIKDVGGFVGGYCNNGSRSDIRHRSILCLDADYADFLLWDDWRRLFGSPAAVYSTHKHTSAKPRLRLVIPLDRDVTPDEYQALGRMVASKLGIDKFDDTSYQPQRMMYWPSCSLDGEYVFEYYDGELGFLHVDTQLSYYHNWRDVSSWPMSSRVAEVVKKAATQQQDPLTKPGLIGAFCRAYSIEEAIAEFVPAYAPCDGGRYTYTEGSTAAGVVTYDGKFAYSHHATDPASMQLCNAWDLVRLHKFGVLDADADPAKPVSSRPSYKAMAELAADLAPVKAQLLADRMAEAGEDFAEELAAPATGGDPDAWKARLKFTEKGTIASTIQNVVIILNGDPELSGRLALDEMANDIVTRSSLPWRKVTDVSQWVDSDDAALRFYLERRYGLSGKDKIFDAVNVVALQNAFHPVKDFLEGCQWDGVKRVETLLVDYMGADDTEYTRTVTRKVMAAAVARIYQPGCKFDYMLTLRGAQGLGKSSFIGLLGGKWFSDTLTTVQGKEALEQIQGVWIMEVGELAGMRKAEVESIKLFLSKRSDRFRPAYGRRLQEYPRQCIFIGSTNESQFLRDTENRRFWVVDTPHKPPRDFWADLTPEVVRLIWAEAVELYRNGEPLYLSAEMEAVAREIQEAYEETDPRVGIVEQFLERKLPEDWAGMDLYARRQWLEGSEPGTVERTTVCSYEIWAEALGQNPDRMDAYEGKKISTLMGKLKRWKQQGNAKITAGPYGRQKYYRKEGR